MKCFEDQGEIALRLSFPYLQNLSYFAKLSKVVDVIYIIRHLDMNTPVGRKLIWLRQISGSAPQNTSLSLLGYCVNIEFIFMLWSGLRVSGYCPCAGWAFSNAGDKKFPADLKTGRESLVAIAGSVVRQRSNAAPNHQPLCEVLRASSRAGRYPQGSWTCID